MNVISGKILKLAAVVTGALLALLLLVQGAVALKWPPWAGLFLGLLLIGVCLAVVMLRRLWLWRRERELAETVSDAEPAPAIPEREAEELNALKTQWKRGLRILRRSHLKRQGNPLYVLPWYLVIGASGSGKSACLSNCGLSSHFLRDEDTSVGSPTRNCEWWLFDQSVVIDTAGRYTVPEHEVRDKEQWRLFLRLLLRNRRREPLNGVVVTVAADQLLHPNAEELAGTGRLLRRRLDQLMRGLGYRFPVYLLVTKCDLIDGFTELAAALPAKSCGHPMGAVKDELTTDVGAFLETAFTTVADKLRALRLYLLRQHGMPAGSAVSSTPVALGMLQLPEAFANLKLPLALLLAETFGVSPYRETPLLRGIFFTSAEQNGAASAAIEPACGSTLPPRREEPSRGLFLHDLFARTLPADRALGTPTKRAAEWRRVTDNLGLVAWSVAGLALCGLLTVSFAKNIAAIRLIAQDVTATAVAGNAAAGAGPMLKFRDGILAVEERNRRWWMPRFGLNESVTVESELKSRFCRQFREGTLAAHDAALLQAASSLAPASPDRAYAEHVLHLARRINLIRARLKGSTDGELRTMPQPREVTVVPPGTGDRFDSLYLSYLGWSQDPMHLRQELTLFQERLRQLLAVKRNLQWSLALAELDGKTPPVTLADFWGGSRRASVEPSIAPYFSNKGRHQMEAVLHEIELAVPAPQVAEAQRSAFETWYRQARRAAWEAFAAAFPRGAERLAGEREWQEVASRMASDEGPYAAFVKRITTELGSEAIGAEVPTWLRQLIRLQMLASRDDVPQALGKATEGGRKLLASLEQSVGRKADAKELEAQAAGQQALRSYRAALAAIVTSTTSRNQAFQAAALLFSEDPAVGKSPFWTACSSARGVETSLARDFGGNATVSRLVTGPLDFLLNFVRREAAGSLQSQWEEQVLAGTLGLSGAQATPLVLGPEGLAWKFVRGPAAPFISRSAGGYRSKPVLGAGLPFEGAFFQLLERGNQVQAAALTRQSNYAVGIQGLPTDANPEARVRPHATRLELHCAAGSQQLANLNYPVGKTFNWSPEGCGDVQLQIEVGDLVLTRNYPGPQGFPEFLQAFSGGQHTFTPRDFPGERSALERMGIRYLRVAYHLTGSEQVIKQGAGAAAGQIPRYIARGWSN
ncbi:type VI secretion protein IcmF/TssM N-terminal domain-containing protein [Geomesophilobacter sediminis]|uniref:Type VI secretion system protein ImpL n=1 Tax=Geomesophilobacter sediminis TaxID=2798584 RepID=A0A8J7LY81_9BACT|nr:type VI secretion protein IcmF/TssM N-terminal domain-containing protein [Geomesophilobacter sediminis]MBJ6724531.1 type VI secretion system protein ImpL [Geomesophilobacter sediminis]